MRTAQEGEKLLQFRPAREKTSFLTVIFYVLASFFLIYKATLWWEGRQSLTKPHSHLVAPLNVQTPNPDTASTTNPKNSTQQAAHLVANEPPAPGTVSKCIAHGQVTYSDTACPQGAVVGSVKLLPSAGVAVIPEVRMSPQIPVTAPQSDDPPTSQPTLHSINSPTPAKSMECKQLDNVVKQIDQLALQPLSLTQQDLLRQDRKKARDRQFFLGC